MNLSHLYQQIEQLSADAITLSHENKFIDVPQKLIERQGLLEKLKQAVQPYSDESEEKFRFFEFLRKIKSSDDKELNWLNQERTKALSAVTKQQKTTQAVNKYRDIGKL